MENVGEFVVNHWLLVTLFVVLAFMILSDSLNRKLSGVHPVGAARAVQLVNQQKGVFLDIREPVEYDKEYIAESVSMPLSSLADKMTSLKDKAQTIVVICASGQRARSASKQLKNAGYSDVYILSGGLNAWKEAKLPLFS